MHAMIASKLLPPYAGERLIERPRLLEFFCQAKYRHVTTIIAPAGYGKTVLMVQLADMLQKPLAWYQLDEHDNDPAVFLQYLVAGLQRHFPDFGKEILQLVAQGRAASHRRLLVTAAVQDLTRQAETGLVIVLDDYHVLTEPVIHSFVQELLKYLPGEIQVIIASRTVLPFSLSRLSLQGEVCVVGREDLRFTRQEVGAFFAQRSTEIPDKLLEALEQKTAGWPAALRFVGDSLFPIEDFLHNNDTQKLYDYLAADVLDRQPEPVREFLVGTSVLDVMAPAFCDLLLERTDSHQILDFLEKQQLFLISLTGKSKVYRYHQLFREFLQDRLGTKRQALLQRAGILAREAGDTENAIEYLVAAGSDEEAITMIKTAGRQAFRRGCWQTVARWLGPLPQDRVATDPWLCLHRATVEVYRGRLEEAENWSKQATTLFVDSDDQEGVLESRLLEARILRLRGRYRESLEHLEQIELKLSPAEKKQRFDIPMEKSLCLFVAGRFSEAEVILTAGIETAKRNSDNYSLAHLLEGLGNLCYMQGNYPKALQMYRKSGEASPERILPGYYTQDSISTIYQDWGEFDQALNYAKRNVAIKENLGLTESLPSAYIQLASIHADLGEWQTAEEYYNQAINLIRDNNGERFYLALNLVFLAQCLSLQGRWIEARQKAEDALAEAQMQGGVALAVCRVVGAAIFVQTGSIDEGKAMLQMAITDFEQMGFKKAACFAYAFQAWFYFNADQLDAAREYAGKSLELAARLNYLQLFLTYHMMLRPILKIGLESGIEVTFVQRILVRQGESALPLLLELSGHACPEVRRWTIAPLTEIGGSQALKAVACLTADPDQGVRHMARLAAQRLGLIVPGGNRGEAAATPLQIAMLGAFRVFLRGVEIGGVNWRTVKTRDLLAYLVQRGEPVSKEKILEDLWPEVEPETATVIFHTTLYNLRRVMNKLGYPDITLYGSRRYQLRPGSFTSDLQQFQELVAAGLRKDNTPETAAATLEQAMTLYRGDYLEDLDYPWLLPQQENLRHTCIEARMYLARYYLQAQDYTRAIAHLQIVEEYDPFAEDVYALLMTAHAKLGNRQAVKKQYQKLETVLKKELGLSPSPAIRRLCLNLIG